MADPSPVRATQPGDDGRSGTDRVREAVRLARGDLTGGEVAAAIERTWSDEYRAEREANGGCTKPGRYWHHWVQRGLLRLRTDCRDCGARRD